MKMKYKFTYLLVIGLIFATSIQSIEAKPKTGTGPVYEAKFKIVHMGKFFGDYSEKLNRVKEGLRFEYILEMGTKESKRTEAFIGFVKDDKNLTPIRYSLTFDVPSANSTGENWIQGELKDGKLVVLTREGAAGKELKRELTKGTFMSSVLPLYLSRLAASKEPKVEFFAFDEEGKIDKFHSVHGVAKRVGSEKINGKDTIRYEVSWGLLNTIFWILPDGSLAKMDNPTSKLVLERVWES